jgi:NAD(P)-dependent dehydrogenase (short-subunit alcohol dehydrogenase family)
MAAKGTTIPGSTFVPTHHHTAYPGIDPTKPSVSAAGKSVLVTGGGYGIGTSIARAFALAGASRIGISGRTESKLKATAAELTSEFPNIVISYYVADITDKPAIDRIFEQFGAPDVLVNNAGFLPAPNKFKDVDIKEWWEGFEINVLGTAIVTQSFLQKKPSEKEAVVVTINTVSAHWGKFPGMSSYAASKSAALRMSELFQVESPEVRFVSLHPGLVHTDLSIKSGLIGQGLPLTDAELTGDFVVWSASSEAEFLKGRFAWVNWDVEELKAKKEEIISDDLLLITMEGFWGDFMF